MTQLGVWIRSLCSQNLFKPTYFDIICAQTKDLQSICEYEMRFSIGAKVQGFPWSRKTVLQAFLKDHNRTLFADSDQCAGPTELLHTNSWTEKMTFDLCSNILKYLISKLQSEHLGRPICEIIGEGPLQDWQGKNVCVCVCMYVCKAEALRVHTATCNITCMSSILTQQLRLSEHFFGLNAHSQTVKQSNTHRY